MIQVGYAATAVYAGRGSYAALATTDSLDVTLFEGAEPLTRIRGGHSPREVTSREKEAWTELYLETFPAVVRPTQRALLEQSTVRDTYPAFGALKSSSRCTRSRFRSSASDIRARYTGTSCAAWGFRRNEDGERGAGEQDNRKEGETEE